MASMVSTNCAQFSGLRRSSRPKLEIAHSHTLSFSQHVKPCRTVVAMASSNKFFVGGNWKCNGTKESITKLVSDLNNAKLEADVDVVVAPPFVYIDHVKSSLTDRIEISAQNSWVGKGGAFTGEISVEQLKDIGCKWVVLGHSERRHIIGEDDQFIGKKAAYALSEGLGVIACIGELLEEREAGKTFDVCFQQLRAYADAIPSWDNVAQPSSSSSSDLLQTLGDFTSKENWDTFFTIRGGDDSFEWYAEWPQLRDPLITLLGAPSSSPQILVPGCGNSRLSEHLYDAGFRGITNVDFSKVVISDMLRRNVRDRPDMRWRVMDMTCMQFMDETFDLVLDKGGLDALMEPELGPKLGNQYSSEVKRVLKSGGKFICLTLAESHVLGLLFSKFRFGWKMSVHAIPQKPSSAPGLQTFMVVAEKEKSPVVLQVTSSFDHSSLDCNKNQAFGIHEALENENQIRREYSNRSDILYSLEDLHLGGKGDLIKLNQGRRFEFMLGGEGDSRFSYRTVLLDAREDFGPFIYNCGVFIVPKTRAHEWLFSSEEGQWLVVESSKAERLIMVLLDSSHGSASMDEIQKDLSPLVKQLAPGKDDHGAQIPFMMAGDGIKQRNVVHQATSSLTGPIIVEDVVYENVDPDVSRIWPSEDLKFRRLVFQRTQGLVQSEALLVRDGSSHTTVSESDRKKASSSSKSKRKVTQRRNDDSGNQLKVYHGYLASSYHMGIISGFILISSYLKSAASVGKSVKAVVIGLGAGLLPMFLHGCMPFLEIEAVELDPMMLNLARDYFTFTQDKTLKVHIADGIQFVRERKNSSTTDELSVVHGNEIAFNNKRTPSNENCTASNTESGGHAPVDILIIDVDSPDSSSGMTCPAADFVEESFLLTVKDALSEQGLFIVNLVSRSQAIKDMVISRMKTVFSHLFCLQLEEDVNLVLFGLCLESCIKEDSFPNAAAQLEELVKFQHPEISQSIMDAAKKIRCLK